ncbi:putative secreted glycosidase [Ceratocystis fimbriata CBS 114723]|uniref:Putative secreted glycosidase n=1 Tax=Ceratocystis fimbriata CBS 114723 TaxID=1035309 RepID=A0A2C5XLZ5_9PEZI|nr:putative secreted glycosidase [Ceratocystis fimbriata CBS 114723]
MVSLKKPHILAVATLAAARQQLAEYVLTDTGSINGGNTFPGVTVPLGMVKLGPDLYTGHDSYSGYAPDGVLMGFSMLHESGTGGAPKYGVVAQLPVVRHVDDPLADWKVGRGRPDETEVGHYKFYMETGIVAEMSATAKAGILTYTFPNGSEPGIIVDVGHVLSSYRGQGLEQHYLGGRIEVKEKRHELYYTGYGDYDNGWNRAEKWRVFFCGYFDAPASFKTFIGTASTQVSNDTYSKVHERKSTTENVGAVFSFSRQKVTSRIGVSFISEAQACENVDYGIPPGTSVSTVRDSARKAWETQVLGKVTTRETNVTKLQQLYTALYFSNLLPTNKTGENPKWDSDEPYYDDIFTFWDTFRCTTSLLHILQPDAYEEFIRSWIDIWRHEGFMSDARSSFFNGAVQAGSNIDNVFADAFVKGVRGKIDWTDAYNAMLTNAEIVPPNNDDPRDTHGSTKEGRGALPDWLSLGYITRRFTSSVTRAVEYSTNDFALSQVASGLGFVDEATKYLNRSRNWRNHWNPDMKALGHSGFLGPREEDGFVDQDPLSCGGCYWGDDYYQGLPWEYSFNAHHDMAKIIDLVGGPKRFIHRLELTFTPNVVPGNGNFDHTIFNPGNEPSFGTPFLYNFAHRQYLSVNRSRFIANSYYSPSPGGLPGNSDAGAMESWLLWNMLGLYPLTGQTTFLVGSPWLCDATIHLGEGRTLQITASNGSEDSFYVQELRVNGQPWNQSWVSWGDVFERGGTLAFVLGSKPVKWDIGPLPPSPATEATHPAYLLTEDLVPGGYSRVWLPPMLARAWSTVRMFSVALNMAIGMVLVGCGIVSWRRVVVISRHLQANTGEREMLLKKNFGTDAVDKETYAPRYRSFL